MEKKMAKIVAKMEEKHFSIIAWGDDISNDDFQQRGFITAIMNDLWTFITIHFSFEGNETVVTIMECNQRPKRGDVKEEIWSSEKDDRGECPLKWVLEFVD